MFKILIAANLILCLVTLGFSQRWLAGKWEGTGYQTDSNETWTMKLRVQKRKFIIEYPSLECSGEWRLINFSRTRARLREKIKVNTEDCEPTGNVIIQRLNKNQLMFLYSYNGTSRVTASAILNRTR